MISILRTVFRCPYCPVGRGEIAIDLAGAMNWVAARPASQCVRLERDEPPFVAFDPDAASGGPCEHQISFYIDMRLRLKTPDGAIRCGDVSLDWNHRWFSRHDADQRLQIFLWENVACEQQSEYAAFLPRIPHRAHRVNETVEDFDPATGEALTGRVIGWFITAVQPQTFLAQLPGCEERLQEFWSREGSGG